MAKDEDQQQAPEPDVLPSTERAISIDLSDVDDDEPGDKQQAGERASTPEDRKGRRAQFRELKESRKADAERMERMSAELAELRGRVAGFQAAPAPQYVQQERTDPAEAEIESLWSQQQMLLRSIQAPGATQKDVDEATTEWRKLDRKRRNIEVKQAVEANQGPRDGGVTEERVANQLLQSEYPEIFTNEAMRMRAQAEMQELMGVRGKPKSIATAREACERVAERYGLRKTKAPAPSAAEQARYTSIPSRAGTASSASGQYVPSQAVLRTARGYTSHLPDLTDEERVRKWVKEVGKPNGLVG